MITLKFSNDYATSNNKNLSYKEQIFNQNSDEKNFYKFEGYKVYQVKSYNYNLKKLGDANSKLIYVSDLNNGIKDISNWKLTFDANGNEKWIMETKVNGEDSNSLSSLNVEKDFFTNESFEYNKEYYYVVVAYAYNNYLPFDPISGIGQQKQYIEGNENVKVHSIRLKYENKNFDAQITRLHGQGAETALEVLSGSHEKFLDPNFNGRVVYESGKGPFDIKINDESKIKLNKKYQVKIEGEINTSAKVCTLKNEEAYFTLLDKESGQVIKSNSNLLNVSTESIDELGFQILLKQTVEPNNLEVKNEGYFEQKVEYQNPNGIKWLSAVFDIDDSRIIGLDPYINGTKFDKTHDLFMPLFNARIKEKSDSKFFISPISTNLGATALREKNGVVKIKDLNNVDIVFTSDKSKWSRCIVVETARDEYRADSTYTTQDDLKMHEIRQGPSVDKNGLPDDSGTNGFSWFPGYAVDVETGKRLNIYFGENTVYREFNKFNSFDMIFNPSDELIDEKLIDIQNPQLKLFAGGQHFIYVTRQDYDECKQLADLFKKGNFNSVKLPAIGATTWTSMPLLNQGTSLKSMQEGLIPNDVTIKLRVNNQYMHEYNFSDITKLNTCLYYDDVPTYEFEFVKKVSAVNEPNQSKDYWKYYSDFNGFDITALSDNLEVEIFDISGRALSKAKVSKEQNYAWKNTDVISNQLLFVKVTASKSKAYKIYKLPILK